MWEIVRKSGVEEKQRNACLDFARAFERLLRRSVQGHPPAGFRRLFARYCERGIRADALWRVVDAIEARRMGMVV